MNVREVLENAGRGFTVDELALEILYEYQKRIAPDIEKGLRASAQEMAEMLTRVEAGGWLVDQCVTAGVAAMVEGA